jgi:integrase
VCQTGASMSPARRQRGEGGLYQRHDHETCPPPEPDEHGKPVRPDHRCKGRWVATILYSDPMTGITRRKTLYGPTLGKARVKLNQARGEAERGALAASNMTVTAWLDYWLRDIAAERTKPQTLAGYQSKVKTLIVPHLGHHRLTTLRPEHVRAWLRTLRATGSRTGGPLTEATVRQAYVILHKALKDAINDGRLSYNPLDRVDAPGTQRARRRGLTVAQAQHLLARNLDARWWLAVFYGMRQGEVLGLRWGDVDLEAGVLTVAQTLQRDGRTFIFGSPKAEASERVIPILPQVALPLRLAQPAGADPDSLVFTDPAGNHVKPCTPRATPRHR